MEIIIIIGIVALLWALERGVSSFKNTPNYGERCVARKLKRLSKEYVTLNDILLPTHYGTTQIDHIVVSPYGIFVIETKDYKGWISGHEDSEEWKQSLIGEKRFWGRSKKQYRLPNPILQNKSHTKALNAILKKIGYFPIIPIVVFSDNAELKITTPNYTVINWCDLRSTIKSYKIPIMSQENVQLIASTISSANITTKGSRENHIRYVETIKQNKEQAISNGKCPRCGGHLVERKGKHGKFLGCSHFPKCRFTKNF